MGKQPKRLGEILIENGVLTEEHLQTALEIHRREGGLIGEILLKHKFVEEKDVVAALLTQSEYLYVKEESAVELFKKRALILGASLLFAIIFLSVSDFLPFVRGIDSIFYGALLKADYVARKPPSAANDILLVTIDNETIENMPHRWPYPRADFATVIENILKADPVAIALDFVFYGKTSENDPDDLALQNVLKSDPRIIAASNINQQSELSFSNNLASSGVTTGIITKFQDPDEVIRRCLTYLISGDKSSAGMAFLSWEMQILRIAKGIDVKSFDPEDQVLRFRNLLGKKWSVPVDPDTKSFLIRFRAHTRDFRRISFYRLFRGDFDPRMIKNKIVMVGLASALLQDFQHTPVGWMPGLNLNANSFLTLYTGDFLRNMPRYAEFVAVIIGVLLGAFWVGTLNVGKAILFMLIEIVSFFLLSYILLLHGLIWNYALFVLSVSVIPWISKRLVYYFKPS